MNLKLILDILIQVFLQPEVNTFLWIFFAVVYIIGLWGVFRKCGIRPWWALVPVVRDAKLGEAADMEKEGRVFAAARGLQTLCAVVRIISLNGRSVSEVPYLGIVEVFEIFLYLIVMIYKIRILLSLTHIFGLKKRWILLWLAWDGLFLIIIGWKKKHRPLLTVQDIRGETAEFFSSSKAVVLDQGLTVNLEERTVRDFFKKKYLLRDIHMYIQPGHMVLLLGGSGAGKTTFL